MENQGKFFGVMVLSCTAALVMLGGSAHAQDVGMINFTGQVVSSTCTYAQTMNVPLPPVAVAELNEARKTAGLKKFDIVFSNCPAGASVRAGFVMNPTYVDTSNGLLRNLKGEDISGSRWVMVALTDKDGNIIRVGQGPQTDTPVVTDDAGKATLTYGAEYYAMAGRGFMAPGQVAAAIGFVADYQ